MAMALTLLRFFLIIPFSACFFIPAAHPLAPHGMTIALVIFIIASITDYLDGYVARARNEVSVLGAALDPLADKMLIAAALLLMVNSKIISGIAILGALIILMREVMVTGFREAIALQGGSLPVTKTAKWKTTLQMIALPLLLATTPAILSFEIKPLLGEQFLPLAIGVFWAAVCLTLLSGADYTIRAVKFLRNAS